MDVFGELVFKGVGAMISKLYSSAEVTYYINEGYIYAVKSGEEFIDVREDNLVAIYDIVERELNTKGYVTVYTREGKGSK